MRLLLFFFALVFVCQATKNYDYLTKHLILTEGEEEDVSKIAPKCLNATNADPKLLRDVEMGKPITDEKAKCYYFCYFLKFGTMQVNGDFTFEKLRITMRRSQYRAAEYCLGHVNSTDNCERAYQMHSCWIGQVFQDKRNCPQ